MIRVFKKLPSPAYFTSFAHLSIEYSKNFLPVVFPLLIVSMGLTYAQVGAVVLAGHLSGTIFQPVFGYISDRSDPRKLIAISIIWIGVLMGLVGFINTYWVLVVVVGLAGLASSSFHPAGAALTSTATTQNRGTAMSLFSVGGNLGSTISPLVVGMAVAAWGLRGTAVLIPTTLLVGILVTMNYRKFPELSNRPGVNDQSNSHTPNSTVSKFALLLIVIYVSARSWFQGTLTTYLPEYFQLNGHSLEAAGGMLSLFLLALSIGSIFGGPLSDRIGHIPILLGSAVSLGPFFWLFLNAGEPFQPFFLILVGVAIGATFAIAVLMAQEAWPGGAGMASSFVIGVGWLPAGIGSWVVGLMADQTTLPIALASLVYVPLVALAAGLVFAFISRS